MACPNTAPSSLPRNSCAPIPFGPIPRGPFSQGPCQHGLPHSNPGAGHCGHQHLCIDSVEKITMLRSRIAALEVQLAHANAEKETADASNRYLLRLLSAGTLVTGLSSTSAEEVPELRHKLLISKMKKDQLKAELHKAQMHRDLPTRWLGPCCRTQASSATVLEGLLTTDAKQTELHLPNGTEPITHPLIDLDFDAITSAEGTPELDQCDDYSTVSDDSDELSGVPSGTFQPTYLWGHGVAKQDNVKPVEIFPEQSSYLRHFLCASTKDNTSAEASACINEPAPPSITMTSNDIELTKSPSCAPTFTTRGAKIRLDSGEPATSSIQTSRQADQTELEQFGSRARAVRLNSSSYHPGIIDRPAAAHAGLTWGPDKLFVSAQEREVAISIHKNGIGPTEIAFPDIFKYGICYNPGPSVGDVYRTVSILGLRSTVPMTALLDKVRGGIIISAKLLDTTTITGSNTALITFLHERAAMLFEDYAMQHSLTFAGHRVKVELLSKPTWPTPIPLQKAIYDHGHTRCLTVHNFPRNISPEALRRDLRVCSVMVTDRIESMCMRTDGVLELHFESIWTAGKAYGILTSWRVYRQCKVEFSSDPCAQPLDILNKQTDPAFNSTQLKSSRAEEPQTFPAESPGGNDDANNALNPTIVLEDGDEPLVIREHLTGISTGGPKTVNTENPIAGV